MLGSEKQESRRHPRISVRHLTRRFANAAIGFGCVSLAGGILTSAILLSEFADEVRSEGSGGALLAVTFLPLIVVGLGVLLVTGGVKLRRFEESGRRMLLLAVAVAFLLPSMSVLLQIAAAIYVVFGTAGEVELSWLGAMGIALTLAFNTAFLYLLWRAFRFLRSPSVMRLCAESSMAER